MNTMYQINKLRDNRPTPIPFIKHFDIFIRFTLHNTYQRKPITKCPKVLSQNTLIYKKLVYLRYLFVANAYPLHPGFVKTKHLKYLEVENGPKKSSTNLKLNVLTGFKI